MIDLTKFGAADLDALMKSIQDEKQRKEAMAGGIEKLQTLKTKYDSDVKAVQEKFKMTDSDVASIISNREPVTEIITFEITKDGKKSTKNWGLGMRGKQPKEFAELVKKPEIDFLAALNETGKKWILDESNKSKLLAWRTKYLSDNAAK